MSGMQYGGTLDVTGTIKGQPYLVDFKSTESTPSPGFAIQLSAYESGIPRPLSSTVPLAKDDSSIKKGPGAIAELNGPIQETLKNGNRLSILRTVGSIEEKSYGKKDVDNGFLRWYP